MGWFDEQLRQRARYDQEEFEESMLHMASSLIGGRQRDTRDVTAVTLDAVNAILKYYKCKSVEVPDTIEGPERQMEYCLRRHGIMSREVVLGEKWWKEAAGPMILYRKEGRIPAVAIPGTLGGYNIYENGSKLKADAKTFSEYEKKAVCFYDPLPQGSLGIKDLFAYMRKCLDKSDLIFVIILTLLITIAGMLLPRMTMVLTSVVSASKDSVFLAGTGVYMLSALIASTLISVTRTLMMSRLGSKMSLGVESAVMMRVINLPADFFRKYNSGELYSRVNSVGTLCNLLMGTVLTTLLTSISSLLYIRQIASFAPALLIPSVLILITTSVITVVTAMAQRRVNESVMQNQAKETGLTLGLISGVQKIRLTGSEKRAFSKWVRAYSKTASDMYDPPLFLKISGAVITGVGLVGTIILYFTAAVNNISPSEYISFNQSYGAVMGAFTAVSAIATSMAQIRPLLHMAGPLLEAVPEVSEDREILTSVSGGIELNQVSFRYTKNMPYVIDGMSLKIKPGEYVAIVGKTGCGKSTLMRLLLGFEKPERGAVYFDGKDITGVDLQSLRRQIGTVTQNGSLFQGSIYSNIAISAPGLPIKEAWEAAEIAGMAEDIRNMPMGMFTMISEGQGGVSGGQKQRLMIARAIAPKPKILMFDEATSALDNMTQKQVSESLDTLKCTRIIIAHRLSTIRHCDRILMLEGGKIVEEGSYDELIALGGRFADMVERQRLDIDE